MNRPGSDTRLPSAGMQAALDAPVRQAGYGLQFVLFKWLPQMAVVVALGLVFGLGYLTLWRGDLFQASAKLYVRVGVDQTPSPLLAYERNVTFLAQTRGAVQSEMDLLRSEVLASRVIADLGLANPQGRPEPTGLFGRLKNRILDAYDAGREFVATLLIEAGLKAPLSREAYVKRIFAQSLILDNAVGSDVISVSLRMPDEAQAVRVLDRFLQIYENFRSAVFQASGETDFLTAKRDAAKSDVEAVEAEMARFERENDIRNSASRAPLLEADLVEAQRAVARSTLDLGLARRRLERLDRGFVDEEGKEVDKGGGESEAAGPGALPENAPPLAMAPEITELLGQREQLRVNYTGDAPQMKEIDAKIAALTIIRRRQLAAEVQDLTRRAATDRERRGKVEASLRDLQQSAMGWKSLERRRDLAETRYRDIEKRLNEARDINALRNARLSNVVVVQPAVGDGVPVGLRKLPMMGIVAFCSMVLACGWAVARETFDDRLYRGEAAAHRLGLPLLGELPERPDRERSWFRRRAIDHAGEGRARLALDRAVVALDERLKAEETSVLAVVGTAEGDGASALALALAMGIGGRRARRVCLVTASHNAAVQELLRERGLVPEAGPAAPDMPAGIRMTVADAQLTIAACDDLKAIAVLLVEGAETALHRLGEADLVIVDPPPLSVDPETAPAAARADATVLVVAAGRHDAGLHAQALDTLSWHGADVMGLILTDVRRFVPAWRKGSR